jgi:hypothetical protein
MKGQQERKREREQESRRVTHEQHVFPRRVSSSPVPHRMQAIFSTSLGSQGKLTERVIQARILGDTAIPSARGMAPNARRVTIGRESSRGR